LAERVRERAVLVGLETRKTELDAGESLAELRTLAESAGAEVIESVLQTRAAPDPATLIGSGKVKELAELAEAAKADLILFDHDLTGPQLRNLEKALPCKVLDRTQLILDIFASRARTREGQLQVELAQLNYLLPRLTGRGAAMSRLGGGIGTRGPGETKLETDRRRIWRRLRNIEKALETVRSTRRIQRGKRESVPLATVALAGYTNAGKSTLFNRLTGAGVLADAKMFATLDPTVRQLALPSKRKALVSDTVGFIRNLPTTLVKAFRATLEEVKEAALILHVVDASSDQAEAQTEHVLKVLGEIEAGETPQILVLNKLDLVEEARRGAVMESLAKRLAADSGAMRRAVAVSARTGEGVEDLRKAVDEMLDVDRVVRVRLHLPAGGGAALHMIHEHGKVIETRYDESGVWVLAEVPESVGRRLTKRVN
jgi:GTP-binding protein HflX